MIHARAPVRICDNGGWTDTWFSAQGAVFNIAVEPLVEVQIKVGGSDRIIHAENFGERYVVGTPGGNHPLLEATIQSMALPDDLAFEVTVYSGVPAGAAMGTSAAVTVALIAALDRLTAGRLAPYAIARQAHHVETDLLGWQSGIQDQLAAVYGGINFIAMYAYPHAAVSPVRLPDAVRWQLEQRLMTVYLGKPHRSSDVHEDVIAMLENLDGEHPALDALRHTAARACDALYAGDLAAFGDALKVNTRAQGDLHPMLVSKDAHTLIAIARDHAAAGWKVNGAGGEGGSITILAPEDNVQRRAMTAAIEAAGEHFRVLPTRLSPRGVHTWVTDAP